MKTCDYCGEVIVGKPKIEYEDGLKLILCDFCSTPSDDHEYED